MGAEVALLALAAGASAYNQQRTLKKQDRSAAEGLRRQQQIQREADARVAQQIQQQAQSTAAPDRAQNEAEMLAAIQGAQARARRNLQGQGAVSQDYRQAANDASAGAQDYASQVASLLSVVDAASQQRQREGFQFGDLATDIGVINRRSRGQAHVDDLRTRSIRPNPWIDAAASAMMGASSGMMARGTASGGGG